MKKITSGAMPAPAAHAHQSWWSERSSRWTNLDARGATMRCTTPRSFSRLPQAIREAPRGQLVFADAAVQDELVESGLDHRDGRRQFHEVDEETTGVVGTAAGTRGEAQRVRSSLSRPGDAAQVDGIEEEGADVDIAAGGGCGDGVCDVALSDARLAPDHAGLAGFDKKGEGIGELAGLERVVRRRR